MFQFTFTPHGPTPQKKKKKKPHSLPKTKQRGFSLFKEVSHYFNCWKRKFTITNPKSILIIFVGIVTMTSNVFLAYYKRHSWASRNYHDLACVHQLSILVPTLACHLHGEQSYQIRNFLACYKKRRKREKKFRGEVILSLLPKPKW